MIAAIDRNDEIVRATSPAVWVRDVTRPRVVLKTPSGRTVSRRASLHVRFSESVTGISTRTIRLRNLATGAIVAGRVIVSSKEAWFVPRRALPGGVLYEAEVMGGFWTDRTMRWSRRGGSSGRDPEAPSGVRRPDPPSAGAGRGA